MARSGGPIVTIEGRATILRVRPDAATAVQKRLGDSRVEARRAMAFYGRRRVAGPLFAYLDAHWYSDLPLGDELDIIHSACRGAVVMIDNFQVPDDPGYAFDDCGPGRTLRAYIESRIDRFGLTPLYPTLRSADETGARRGCVVLVNDRQWGAAFRNIGELRF